MSTIQVIDSLGPEEMRARYRDLSDKYRRLLGEIETKSEQLALINGLLRLVNSNVTLDKILHVFSMNLKTLCPFDRLDIALFNPLQRHFEIPFALQDGRILSNPDEYPRPWGATVITKVVQERLPLLRTDIRKDFQQFDTDRLFVKKGYSTELIFPLEIENRVVGSLNIACFEAGKLADRHLRTLYEVSQAVTAAVYRYLVINKLPY